MSQSRLAKITCGHVVNLVTNDIQRLDLATQNLFASIRSPFDLVILGILLWVLIGWQAVTGLSFALMLIPYEAEMTGWVAKLRMRAARITDRRLAVMNEIISGIRAVKMYAWEWPYRDVVRQIRRFGAILSCSFLFTLYYIFLIQLFQNRLSKSIVDTGTERNFGYSHNE